MGWRQLCEALRIYDKLQFRQSLVERYKRVLTVYERFGQLIYPVQCTTLQLK